ncbi:keratin, type II microfibrillar, component 7C-like [Manis javanica]|uniref:keratin, type II microfibrillar, component 7C-like n=1 Tax=Manis javanica TaxID=9974 RepID=UPI003C6D78B5
MQTLRHSKEQLNRLNQAIQWVTVEVDRAMSQEEDVSGSTKGKLAWLEATLQQVKQDMARQLSEYQKLMIIKLGLDFEITTYCKLLEVKESRRVAGLVWDLEQGEAVGRICVSDLEEGVCC